MSSCHSIRVIPRLDVKGSSLVKGIQLEGLRVLGKPEEFAYKYYQDGADEIMYQDVVASLYGRNSILDIVSKTAEKIFIPLTVGGGIRTIKDILAVLRAGADKVAINSGALARPEFIKEAAEIFGSSTIVVSIEAIRHNDGTYFAYTDNGREYSGINAVDWSQKAENLGAGEIIITSVDREGTGTGFETELIKLISKSVTIPVVAHGGAGKSQDLVEAVHAGADALCLSSILHYSNIKKLSPSSPDLNNEGNTTFLNSKIKFSKFGKYELVDLRDKLIENRIICRNTN
jgi:cyclase